MATFTIVCLGCFIISLVIVFAGIIYDKPRLYLAGNIGLILFGILLLVAEAVMRILAVAKIGGFV